MTFFYGAVISLAFISYYLGIIIRKFTIPGKNSLPLTRQLLLGIPASLVVVSPLLLVLLQAFNNITSSSSSGLVAGLTTYGLIIEHGMLLNETITSHLHQLRQKLPSGERQTKNFRRIV